jgi:hypothetical protein
MTVMSSQCMDATRRIGGGMRLFNSDKLSDSGWRAEDEERRKGRRGGTLEFKRRREDSEEECDLSF